MAYESGLKKTNLYRVYEDLSDLELLKLLQGAEKKSMVYETVMAVLWDRYLPQIHKNWWVLQRQMNNLTAATLKKDDYYSEAQEVFIVALNKIDLSKVKDDKFKCVGMLNWYLTNLRTKIISEIKATPKTKSIDLMNRIGDDDITAADTDVEEAYWESDGYKTSPEYNMDRQETIYEVREVLNECKNRWSWEENQIFDRMYKGEKRAQIAKELSIKPDKVSSVLVKLKKDLKLQLADIYANL